MPKPEVADKTPAKLRQTAIGLLARREHSDRELRRKLHSRGFPAGDVDSLLLDLAEQGLLSNLRFSEQYIRVRVEKGFGPVRIQAELKERGIASVLYEEMLLNEGKKWGQRAFNARTKRFGADVPSDFKARAKQMRFLQQRGFTQGQIQYALGSSE